MYPAEQPCRFFFLLLLLLLRFFLLSPSVPKWMAIRGGVADVVKPNYDPSQNRRCDEDKGGGQKRKPPREPCVERVCKTAAGLSTPDWRLLVVALPSAVYSRTGISLRTFLRQQAFVSERGRASRLSRGARCECARYFPRLPDETIHHVRTQARLVSIVELSCRRFRYSAAKSGEISSLNGVALDVYRALQKKLSFLNMRYM